MAKNTDHSQEQKAAAQAERGQQQAQQSAMEAQAKSGAEPDPGAVARKHRERRFGHN